MNKIVKTIDLLTLYKEFLAAYNWHYKLTRRELELLEILLEFNINSVEEPGENKNIISTKKRKEIVKRLGITSDNLSRYINKFKRKGIIITGKRDEEFYLNKDLIPQVIGDRVQLTIVLKINKSNGIKGKR